MVAKLATSLGMTRGELESELKSSVQGIKITQYIPSFASLTYIPYAIIIEQGHKPDSEYGVLLSRSVLAIFDGSESTPNHPRALCRLNSTSNY